MGKIFVNIENVNVYAGGEEDGEPICVSIGLEKAEEEKKPEGLAEQLVKACGISQEQAEAAVETINRWVEE